MDLTKYLTVLVVLCLEGGETGGHGGKHHDHVKLHIPEFIHHGRHTKVITIHHHHHKPKKEHHHHHHHHQQKPQIPHGHHHHHHHKKSHTTTHTVSKGHGHHGHHGHQGHHKHHGHHGHHGHHSHGHHHDSPSFNYDPPSIPSFKEDYGSSFTPSVPSYGGGIHQTPQVRGVTHTVKQVKVFDSLPGVIPGKTGSHGYEVTEQGEDADEDVFTSVNGLQQTYPATFGYLRGAAPQPASHDPFAELTRQNTIPSNSHDPFAAVAQPAPVFASAEAFTGSVQNDPFVSATPVENFGLPSGQPSPDFTESFQGDPGIEPISFAGNEVGSTAFSAESGSISAESPVTFTREAGIQHATNTGGVETIEY